MICNMFLTPIVMIVRTLVQVFTTVLQTVCDFVTSVVTTVQQVLSQACSSLGWFSWICSWVVTLVEIVQTVVTQVCNTVTTIVVSVLEVISEVLIYVAKWVCWVFDLGFRILEGLTCRLVKPNKFIHVCITILTDEAGNTLWTVPQIHDAIAEANKLFEQCGITLVKCDAHIVSKPEYVSKLDLGWRFFPGPFTWFSRHTCSCCSVITIYCLDGMIGAEGFSVPGCDWILVSQGLHGGYDIAHEIGHLADLPHSNDEDNVMIGKSGVYGTKFTGWQCCMLRTARFTKLVRRC